MAKRVLFTGGSGKAGRHVVPYLVAQGHRVLNVDRVPLDAPDVDNLYARYGTGEPARMMEEFLAKRAARKNA